jgi:serine phosphatase RsbU (regulator of sigma subunit)
MQVRTGVTLQEALNRLNRFLCDKTSASRFVTMFGISINSDGAGRYISAGHNPSYVFRAATRQVEELTSNNMIVGAFSFATYEAVPIQLDPGDILLAYSDGLTEAENPQGEMLGEEGVKNVILAEAPSGSKHLEQKLLETIQSFTAGRSLTDDITLIIVERV